MAPYKQSLITLLCLFFSVSLQGPLQPSRKDDGYQKPPAVAATSGLVARDRRPVPSLAQLGCDVEATGNGDWMEVAHGRDFVMQARVNGDTVYRKYAEHTNPRQRLVRARDVLMAFWKDYSNDAVGSLRHIGKISVLERIFTQFLTIGKNIKIWPTRTHSELLLTFNVSGVLIVQTDGAE